jgi:hypothetical protein
MRTTILAYVIAILGLIVIIAGAWGLYILLTANMPRVPLRYFAMAIAMISGGFLMLGSAQGLRLLVTIYRERRAIF